MNNVIVIRGDKIAFNEYPGAFGNFANQVYLAPDMDELVTPYGLFLPVVDNATDLIPLMNYGKEAINAKSGEGELFHITPGVKGVLVSKNPDGTLQWYQVRVLVENKIHLTALTTGKDGYAVVTVFDHLAQEMLACIRLTETIEDTVAMFCRHVASSPMNVLYRDREDLLHYLDQFDFDPVKEESK